MSTPIPATLVVATGSALIQQGILALLKDIPQLNHKSSCENVIETIKALKRHKPDVLVAEPALASALHAQGKHLSQTRVLLLSPRTHMGTETRSTRESACGFVAERAPLAHIGTALRSVAECSVRGFNAGACQHCPLRESLIQPALPLSERESTVFEMIGRSGTASVIAQSLGISVKTIETYRENIKRKLGLASATALLEAAFAWKRGDYVPQENLPPVLPPGRRKRS